MFLALLLFPVSITVLPLLHGIIMVLLVATALLQYFLVGGRGSVLCREEKLFFFSICFMVATVLLVSALAGLDQMSVKKIGKFLFLLMAIPVYFLFRHRPVPVSALWYGLVLGACISALVGIYEVVFDVYKAGYVGRAKGETHPIIFGDLALLMGVMSIAGLGWFQARSRWQILLPVLALVSGILASVLSLSRGGWVAIPFFVIVIVWASRDYVSRKLQLYGVGLLLMILALVYVIPQTGMQNKIQMTVENIQAYTHSEVSDTRRATSIGSRFEMWQASWQIFQEHPFLGVGWGNYQQYAQALVAQGVRNPAAGDWEHPHNQFLSALVGGGILAGIAIALLFFLPLKLFVVAFKSLGAGAEIRRFALAGVLLMIMFAIFNLSESFLERSRTVAFFIFYLAVFMAGILENRENNS